MCSGLRKTDTISREIDTGKAVTDDIKRAMSILQRIQRFFGTESFQRAESQKWARKHFPGQKEEVATLVGYVLATQLGVDFNQLEPHTNIIVDLGADEIYEWAEIQMAMEEDLNRYFPQSPGFVGRTIADLVDFVFQQRANCLLERPKRSFKVNHWCLAARLDCDER
jgi:hypothetical protein